MPKKSKKSKSKRQTLKQKYKVLRKVREHHRKKRKEAKKNGTLNKAPRDPGIPNSWPFKEELIQQLKNQKERAAAREKARREASRLAAQTDKDGLEAIQTGAAARARAYEGSIDRAHGASGGYVDYSLKAFFRDFARVVEASDVIIEVLDARDPAGTRCMDVEKFIRRMGPNKKIVLLLNKIDLVPREVVQEWLKYFRDELPAIAFKCSTQRQATNLGRKNLPSGDSALRGSECLGGDGLLQLLKNYARNASGIKSSVTVGVIGLPNVGKSSLINSLKRTRVAPVGNAPGVTKTVQEVHLDRQVTLLDSPGVVFAEAGGDGAAAAALRNAVKIDKLEDPILPVAEIVRRCPAKQLMSIYNVPEFSDVEQFLGHVASARGKLKRGGTVDTIAAARVVLQDWNDGRIPYFTLPSKRESEVKGTAAVVPDWGADFDANAVFAAEETAVIAGLPSLENGNEYFQTQSTGPIHVRMDEAAAKAASEEEEEMSEGSDADEEEEGDEKADEMDEEDGPSNRVTRSKHDRSDQNVQLYGQTGQFNPHAARAERRRKRKSGSGGVANGSDSDYDFDEASWDDAHDANAYAQLASEDDM